MLGATRKHWGVVVAAALALATLIVGAGYTVSGSVTPAPSSAAASTRLVGAGHGASVASVGCGRPPGQSVSDELQGVVVGSTPRWYLLTTPAPTTPGPSVEGTPSGGVAPRPLVLDFHGVGENALAQADTSRFGALGQLDGFVVVTPSGTGEPVHWDTTDPPATNPDLQFVAALVDQVESTQCIDTSRVYATGFSDGAIMASQLACTMSDRIAAVSTISGLAMPPLCNLIRPVPVIAFHGTADPILYFNGGTDSALLTQLIGSTEPTEPPPSATQPARLDGPGEPTTVREWAVKEGCNPTAIDTRVSSQVIARRYACPSGTDIRFYIVLGGGHDWPGSLVSGLYGTHAGMTTFQVDATQQTWEFFQQFHL